jgi:hypothetical protein
LSLLAKNPSFSDMNNTWEELVTTDKCYWGFLLQALLKAGAGVAPVIKCLLCKPETLSSNPSPTKPK